MAQLCPHDPRLSHGLTSDLSKSSNSANRSKEGKRTRGSVQERERRKIQVESSQTFWILRFPQGNRPEPDLRSPSMRNEWCGPTHCFAAPPRPPHGALSLPRRRRHFLGPPLPLPRRFYRSFSLKKSLSFIYIRGFTARSAPEKPSAWGKPSPSCPWERCSFLTAVLLLPLVFGKLAVTPYVLFWRENRDRL